MVAFTLNVLRVNRYEMTLSFIGCVAATEVFAVAAGVYFLYALESFVLLAVGIFTVPIMVSFYVSSKLWVENDMKLLDDPARRGDPDIDCLTAFFCCGLTNNDYVRIFSVVTYVLCCLALTLMVNYTISGVFGRIFVTKRAVQLS